MRLLLREWAWFGVAGMVTTTLALFVMFRFVHSSETISNLALIWILPFGFLSKWGHNLTNIEFWILFVIAQTIYLACIYLLIRHLVLLLRHK